MKTIRIFLASSDELNDCRETFGALIYKLDQYFREREIRLKLYEWEDLDAAYNNRRKQDEYNDKVRKSDIFVALFHQKGGRFTIEEFDVAYENQQQTSLPQIHIYCKDIKEGEVESVELKEFKKRVTNLGFNCNNFANKEILKVLFTQQLLKAIQIEEDLLKTENGIITFNGKRIAKV